MTDIRAAAQKMVDLIDAVDFLGSDDARLDAALADLRSALQEENECQQCQIERNDGESIPLRHHECADTRSGSALAQPKEQEDKPCGCLCACAAPRLPGRTICDDCDEGDHIHRVGQVAVKPPPARPESAPQPEEERIRATELYEQLSKEFKLPCGHFTRFACTDACFQFSEADDTSAAVAPSEGEKP